MARQYFFLALFTIFSYLSSAIAPEEISQGLNSEVQELIEQTRIFSEMGYTEEADTLARKNTRKLLTSTADTELTQDEFNALVSIHLKTQIYYAHNTKWGLGQIREPRIIYDFLSQLDKGFASTPKHKEHLTKFTMLSLAAQEYFWNPRSTIEDLRNHAVHELRYGLFKKPDHILDSVVTRY